MKKFLFLSAIFALLLIGGCKKKVVPVEVPPPPPPPVKQTEQEFVKGLVSKVSQLEPGKTLAVQIDKEKFISDKNSMEISLFPLEFVSPAEKPHVVKYLFPSVVWRYDEFQLPVVDLENYLTCTKPGEKVWILKESPDSKKPFKQIPTLLVDGKTVLDQNGDEMALRANWAK
jgi:TusA-related sulfurtransferase